MNAPPVFQTASVATTKSMDRGRQIPTTTSTPTPSDRKT
jgi:hypothetical protein